MNNAENLLFQAGMLKQIQRTGYAFLGVGRENVAEHSFMTAMIGYVMSELTPEADAEKLISMCLLHDLPEAMIGDINYVQRHYVAVDVAQALKDTAAGLSFGAQLAEKMNEFESRNTLESRLAHDADQLALILDLKSLVDCGHEPPKTWIPAISERLLTETGRKLCEKILAGHRDFWWRKKVLTEKQQMNMNTESYSLSAGNPK